MYNLQRFQGKEHVETHVWNCPYAICKAKKKQLEALKWLPNTYFKITKN